MTDARVNYTGATVVEKATEAGKTKWGKAGQVGCIDADGNFVADKVKMADGTLKAVADIAVNDEFEYLYNNVIIPQGDIPQLVASVDGIELNAKARRIGIYY